MQTTRRRILKNGLIVAGALAVIGMLFGQLAEIWLSSQSTPRLGPMLDDEVVAKATADAPGMSWRVPLAMAFWGFVLVVAFEMMAGFWRKPVVTSTTNRPLSTDAAELAVQQFLREAEAKAANLDQTPLPGNQKASVNSTVIGRI